MASRISFRGDQRRLVPDPVRLPAGGRGILAGRQCAVGVPQSRHRLRASVRVCPERGGRRPRMGVRRPRRPFDGPLLRVAFRTGAGARLAPMRFRSHWNRHRDPRALGPGGSDPGEPGRPTISWIAASAWRPPRGDDSIRIRLASGVADRAAIDARIAADGGHSQSAKVIRPTLGVAFALVGVGKSRMNHAHQRAAVPFDEINLDQA